MFRNKKNKIAGECSRFFAVTPLRFLILSVVISLKAFSINECHVESRILREDTGNALVLITVPGDSVKGKYDINDPRNPHCPCHQYQKLADEEFARLQHKEKNKGNV